MPVLRPQQGTSQFSFNNNNNNNIIIMMSKLVILATLTVASVLCQDRWAVGKTCFITNDKDCLLSPNIITRKIAAYLIFLAHTAIRTKKAFI